jgi:hypothetical protein
MITQDLHVQENETRRVLAVIAERAEQAAEIAAQFARQGEVVETVWYPDSHRLLTEVEKPRFEAVILFPSHDEAETDADESLLRATLTGTPLYRVG